MKTNLAFLLSSSRSGSTLFTRVLDSHPRIAAPCEIALPSIIPPWNDKHRIALEKLKSICDYYGLDPLKAKAEPDYFFSGILAGEKKECLVVKDPRHSLFVSRIEAAYAPKFIWLIRDARAVANSRLWKSSPAEGLRQWWVYSASICKGLRSVPARRRFIVRFEDFIEDPAKTMRGLLGFLGYRFKPAILEYWKFPHADDKMKLWSGKAPKDSFLQQSLYAKVGIEKSYADAASIPPSVLDAYNRAAKIKELNEDLGYE